MVSASDRSGDGGACVSCVDCRHMRLGASIATATFRAMLPAMQPDVQPHHVSALKQEAELAGGLDEERDENRQLSEQLRGLPAEPLDVYSRRPTSGGYPYCGVAEFEGVWHISEIKNSDLHCDVFADGEVSSSRSCETCGHLVEPS